MMEVVKAPATLPSSAKKSGQGMIEQQVQSWQVIEELPRRGQVYRYPWWTLFAFLLGLALFAVSTYSLRTESFLFLLDQPINDYIANVKPQLPQWLRAVAVYQSRMGSQGMIVIIVGAGLYWLFTRQWRSFWLMLVTVGGAEVLWIASLFLIDRARPQEVSGFEWLGVPLPSYPSGHTLVVVAFYGLLLYIFLPRVTESSWRIYFAAAVLVIFVLTGLNRLYLNVHFFTDILAGYGLGLAWTVLAFVLVDWCFVKQKSSNSGS